MLSQNKQCVEVCYGRPPTSFTQAFYCLHKRVSATIPAELNREANKGSYTQDSVLPGSKLLLERKESWDLL